MKKLIPVLLVLLLVGGLLTGYLIKADRVKGPDVPEAPEINPDDYTLDELLKKYPGEGYRRLRMDNELDLVERGSTIALNEEQLKTSLLLMEQYGLEVSLPYPQEDGEHIITKGMTVNEYHTLMNAVEIDECWLGPIEYYILKQGKEPQEPLDDYSDIDSLKLAKMFRWMDIFVHATKDVRDYPIAKVASEKYNLNASFITVFECQRMRKEAHEYEPKYVLDETDVHEAQLKLVPDYFERPRKARVNFARGFLLAQAKGDNELGIPTDGNYYKIPIEVSWWEEPFSIKDTPEYGLDPDIRDLTKYMEYNILDFNVLEIDELPMEKVEDESVLEYYFPEFLEKYEWYTEEFFDSLPQFGFRWFKRPYRWYEENIAAMRIFYRYAGAETLELFILR